MIENRMKCVRSLHPGGGRADLASSRRVERQIDLGREEIYRQLELQGSRLHRASSFDAHHRSIQDVLPSPAAVTPSNDTDDSDAQPSSLKPYSPRKPQANGSTTPQKRREQILARLGLKNAKNKSGRGFPGAPNGDQPDETEDSDVLDPRGRGQSEGMLRRRYSMGTLKRAGRIRGGSGGVLGEETSESDEEFLGDTVGWSSGGSDR